MRLSHKLQDPPKLYRHHHNLLCSISISVLLSCNLLQVLRNAATRAPAMLSTEGWSEASVSVPWLSILLALAACLLFAKVVFDSRQAGLSHIPGPQLAKYTNLWGAWTALQLSRAKSGAAVASFSRDLQRNYGSVVRTGPKTVTILDPQAIPLVYGVRAKLDKVWSQELGSLVSLTTVG